MSGWASLPLLPLRCILEHLSTEDALAAMSTCCHWRSTILLYEGCKETLKLRAKQLEKSMFLTRIFKRHTRILHIYIDCNERELDKFINYVLPQFFDTVKLHEILFVGPSYLRQNQCIPIKLKRILLEGLIFKHQRSIQKVALLGCEMGTVKNESENFANKNAEYYTRLLSFNNVSSPSDTILTRCNADSMAFSTLQHILVDYDQLSMQTLETLSVLPVFTHLSINIMDKRSAVRDIDWRQLNRCYTNTLNVSVNIISLPYKKFKTVVEKVLVEGMMLTSLKVMFCKTLYPLVLGHVSQLYPASLRELVWADGPQDSPRQEDRRTEYAHNANPFILLCWQCVNLKRLVIHGYWVWQYDMLGFIRLRKSLRRLEVSALYPEQGRFGPEPPGGVRVLHTHAPVPDDHHFHHIVNECTDFEWKPIPWRKLHPALKSASTPEQRADYIIQETMGSLGVT